MESLIRDVRFGFRMLTKTPGFTVIAVLILALGIGANTTFFSVVYGILLKPLPFEHPEQLFTLRTLGPNMPEGEAASLPDFADWRSQTTSFEDVVGYVGQNVNFSAGQEPIRLRAARVTSGFFELLRMTPTLGRTFTREDDVPNGPAVVVLGHNLWQRQFGGDPQIIGKTLQFNSKSYTVVGVAPKGMQFPNETDVWAPLAMDVQKANRRGDFLGVLARLKPGVSAEQATAEMQTIATRLEKQYPDTNGSISVLVTSLHEQIVGKTRTGLLVLWGAVLLVLFIVCANLANLLMAREAAREREFAIRTALGAQRGTIVRQLLSEMTLLAAAGGGLGLMLAFLLTDLLISYAPAMPRMSAVSIDAPILLFTLTLTLVTPLLFGVVPAIHGARAEVDTVLKTVAARASAGLRRAQIRRTLVVVQLALSLTLLISAGLLIRSFHRLTLVNPGLRSENVTTFRVTLPPATYQGKKEVAGFFSRLLTDLNSVPGVRTASLTSDFYVADSPNVLSIGYDGQDPNASEDAQVRSIGETFLETAGIGLLKGRTFNSGDADGTANVVLVNKALEQKYFRDGAIGKRIAYSVTNGQPEWRQIVGVYEDVRQDGLDAKPYPEILAPFAQSTSRAATIVVLTSSQVDPMNDAQRIVRSLDPSVPIFNVMTVDQVYSSSVAQRRFVMVLFGGFALVALLLASLGVYGVIAQSVVQRTGEFGIRMALGAQPRDIARLVVGSGLVMVGLGSTVGICAAFIMTRFLQSLLYEVNASDPTTFVALVIVLGCTALIASYVPARRAMQTDPMVALRQE